MKITRHMGKSAHGRCVLRANSLAAHIKKSIKAIENLLDNGGKLKNYLGLLLELNRELDKTFKIIETLKKKNPHQDHGVEASLMLEIENTAKELCLKQKGLCYLGFLPPPDYIHKNTEE